MVEEKVFDYDCHITACTIVSLNNLPQITAAIWVIESWPSVWD